MDCGTLQDLFILRHFSQLYLQKYHCFAALNDLISLLFLPCVIHFLIIHIILVDFHRTSLRLSVNAPSGGLLEPPLDLMENKENQRKGS